MVFHFHNELLKNWKFKRLYIVAAFALMFYAIWLPDFENVLGMEGVKIGSVAAFYPLNGMILGPYLGAAVSFSSMIAYQLALGTYDPFSMATPLFAALSSLVAGLIITKRENLAISIYCMLIILWYMFSTGREAYMLPWFDILGLAVFVLLKRKVMDKAQTSNVFMFLFLYLVSLIAVLSEQMAGSITALIIFDLPAQIYNSTLFIYPVERIILALPAAFIMGLLIILTRNTVMFAGTVEDVAEKRKIDSMMDYIKNDIKKVMEKDSKE